MLLPISNHDEAKQTAGIPFVGNYHKSLPHNDYGEVDVSAYHVFKETCDAVEAGAPVSFEGVPSGQYGEIKAAKLNNPLAGASSETHGIDPKSINMPPAPGIASLSTAAEMVELYWMALLRDVPLLAFQKPCSAPSGKDAAAYAVKSQDVTLVDEAVSSVGNVFQNALEHDHDPLGRVRLGLDLPYKSHPHGAVLDIELQTLFRCGLPGEEYGPLISQFFLRDIPYGVQTISSKQTPYIMGKDFLTNHDDWLRAQSTGKDRFGRDYGTCNNYADQVAGHETYFPSVTRHISTIRDIARFVNRDALHQAYFNAALFLDAIGTPVDPGNPYAGNRYAREGGFGTLGGPDLLTLVSEVASRALKVVWRQKWLVHRRARPEVYGGLLQMQFDGYCGRLHPQEDPEFRHRPYGLPSLAKDSDAAAKVHEKYGGYYLPMAFSAGSPTHPAYGAGHATVAGACVTILKAWYDEDAVLKDVILDAKAKAKDPGCLQGLLQPGAQKSGEDFYDPQGYCGGDAAKITVGGELNKIASNVAMGRSMGGVHWRTDNTRSLRLGERIAIEILRKRTIEYAERPVSFTFRSFDRRIVQIARGQVTES